MRTRSLALMFLPLLMSLLGGCVVTVTSWSPPPGNDVRIDAAWTIDGFAPTPARCASAEIEYVELWIYETSSASAGHMVFDADCVDARVITDWVYPAQGYYFEWVAYDIDGFETYRSDVGFQNMSAGGTWYADVDFESVTQNPIGNEIALYATYDVDAPGATLADACAYAGIDWVEIVVLDSTGTYEYYYDELWQYCGESATGEIDSLAAILPSGNYQFLLRAYDADNRIVDETAPVALGSADVSGGYIDVGDVLFGLNVYLDVTLNYEAYDQLGSYYDCYGAGASTTTFTWTLYDADPELDPAAVALYEDQADDVCWDWVFIDDSAVDDLDIGTYYLELYSTNAGDPAWWVICEIDVDYFGYTSVECDVPIY